MTPTDIMIFWNPLQILYFGRNTSYRLLFCITGTCSQVPLLNMLFCLCVLELFPLYSRAFIWFIRNLEYLQTWPCLSYVLRFGLPRQYKCWTQCLGPRWQQPTPWFSHVTTENCCFLMRYVHQLYLMLMNIYLLYRLQCSSHRGNERRQLHGFGSFILNLD